MTFYDIDIGFLPDPAESHFRRVLMWFVSTLLLLTGIISLVNLFRPCTRSRFKICLCGRDSQKQTQTQASTNTGAHNTLRTNNRLVFSKIFLMFTPTWGYHPIWRAYFWDGWFNQQLDNMECSVHFFWAFVSVSNMSKKNAGIQPEELRCPPARRILGLLAADLKMRQSIEVFMGLHDFFSWCDVSTTGTVDALRNHSPVDRYTPVNQHSNGKSTSWTCISY